MPSRGPTSGVAESWGEMSLCLMMLLEITGYSLLKGWGGQEERQEESEDALRVTEATCLNPICPPHPPGRAAPPLQPGHTQVTVITAPESLGKRVVLNFQLGDLWGETHRVAGRRARLG